jgi:hypothetical protein
MKTLIWSLTALLAALWTGFVALAHRLTGWLLGAIDAGTAGAVPLPPLPDWLALWIDAEALAALRLFGVDLLQWLGAVLPSGEALMAWIAPLLWVGWGFGMLSLLAMAGLLHWLLGRVPAPAPLRDASA